MLGNIKRIVALSLFVILSACSNNSAEIKDVSQEQLMTMLESQNKTLVVDVRTAQEFENGHLPGAINIPHDEVHTRLSEFESMQDKNIVLYCRTGARATFAYHILAKNNFINIEHLSGDFTAWQENGLDIVKGK